MDIKEVREDFPVLTNRETIYLDTATSTLIPTCVIKELRDFYEKIGAVSKRGVHKLTVEATEQYQKARVKVADFFNVAASEIIFVPNESYGLSSLLYALPWNDAFQILTSYLEHHSNYLPILYLMKRFGIEVKHLHHNSEGEIKQDSLERLIVSKTKLISLTFSPLLFGSISPVREIVSIAHDRDIPVLVDGTRIAGHRPIDLKSLGCDFFVCNGNIGLMGPMGTGVLYISHDSQVELNPSIIGSGTVSRVTETDYKLMDLPDKFEPGNPNVGNVVGLGTAVEYLKGIGLANIQSHEQKLTKQMLLGLEDIEKTRLYGPMDSKKKNGIVSFNVDELNAHDMAMYLDEVANIAVRSGKLCSHPMMDKFKIPGVVQASLHLYNSKEDINQFLDTIQTIVKELA